MATHNTRPYVHRVALISSLTLLVFLVPLSGVSIASSGQFGAAPPSPGFPIITTTSANRYGPALNGSAIHCGTSEVRLGGACQ